MELNKIEVAGEHKHLQIREIILVPRLDEDGEPVLNQVPRLDKDGIPVLDNEGIPINDDGEPIIDSGGYHRRIITPDMDVSSEVQEIKDKAEIEWTDGIKTAWAKVQAEQEARLAG